MSVLAGCSIQTAKSFLSQMSKLNKIEASVLTFKVKTAIMYGRWKKPREYALCACSFFVITIYL